MHSERKDQHFSQPRGNVRDKILPIVIIGIVLIGSAIGWLLFRTPSDLTNVTDETEPILVDTPLVKQDTPIALVISPIAEPKSHNPTPLVPDAIVAKPEKEQLPKKPTLRVPSVAELGNGWKKYMGAWFEVEFPETLTPIISLNPSSTGIESIFFQSNDKELEFYVAVSPKRKTPEDFIFDNKVDSLEMRETYYDGNWTKCFNRKLGTLRFYREFHRSNCYWFIGCRSHDSADYERMKEAYERFKKSFVKSGF